MTPDETLSCLTLTRRFSIGGAVLVTGIFLYDLVSSAAMTSTVAMGVVAALLWYSAFAASQTIRHIVQTQSLTRDLPKGRRK